MEDQGGRYADETYQSVGKYVYYSKGNYRLRIDIFEGSALRVYGATAGNERSILFDSRHSFL